jgi:hypothetical protein
MEGVRADIMLVVLAAGVLALLAAALFGGKLPVETRRRVELALTLIFYPVAAGVFLWRAATQEDWVLAAGFVVFAAFIGWNGVRVVRARLRLSERHSAS